MKLTNLFLMWVLLIPLFSCNEKSEVKITETKAELFLPIEITYDNSLLKNATTTTENQFNGTCAFCLLDSKNITSCADILRISSGGGCILSFSGVDDLNDFKKLELQWGFCENNSEQFTMQPPVNLMILESITINGKTEFNVEEIISPLLQNMSICPRNSYKINIHGASKLTMTAELKIPIIVVSGKLTTQFTLF